MKRLFLFIGMMTLIGSCKKENNNNGVGGNLVYITNDITVPTTWYADSIYIINDHDFWVENTLTIQPGTIIKFTSNYHMVVDKSGTVMAQGTAEKPIVFTSIKDDSYGGDCNKDGAASQPSPGDWQNISVTSNGNIFSYCKFMYGGGSSYFSTLEITGGNATITHCTFTKNKGGKAGSIYSGALDAGNAGDQTLIQHNVFYNNNLPLSLSSVISLDNTNLFHDPANAAAGNTMNGIFIYDIDEIRKAVSWEETEVPFVINDVDLWIESPGSLTLAPNVIVKFTPESRLVIGTGATLSYNATNYFTSFKDDSHGGDTNGDGNATSPSDGDWLGIWDDATSTYLSAAGILYDNN